MIDKRDPKSIRQALKNELGYNARAVTVKMEKFSLGRTNHVTIRDANVDYQKVVAFAEKCGRIDRCSQTGEIQGGGNVYVEVHITRDVMTVWAEPLLALLAEYAAQLDSNGGIPIEGTTLTIWRGEWGDGYFHLTGPPQWRTPDYKCNEDGFLDAAVKTICDLKDGIFIR